MEGARGTCVMCVGDGQCTDLITEAGTYFWERMGRQITRAFKEALLGSENQLCELPPAPAYPSVRHCAIQEATPAGNRP